MCKEAFSLDIVLHVSSESYIVPTNIYTIVTAVLSIDATCMVSWNYSIEYKYTSCSVCDWGAQAECGLALSIVHLLW